MWSVAHEHIDKIKSPQQSVELFAKTTKKLRKK